MKHLSKKSSNDSFPKTSSLNCFLECFQTRRVSSAGVEAALPKSTSTTDLTVAAKLRNDDKIERLIRDELQKAVSIKQKVNLTTSVFPLTEVQNDSGTTTTLFENK